MSELVLTNAFISVAGTDMSDHVRQITINYGSDIEDSSAMSVASHARLGGLKDWSVDVEFNQDYAVNDIDDKLFDLVGTSVALIIRPVATAKSTSNPEFTGNAILESYNPLQGAIGAIAIAPATFQGNGALARDAS